MLTPRTEPLRAGDRAPDFELPDDHRRTVRLADLRGDVVVLMFFPLAFTPTCTGELCAVRDLAPAIDHPRVHVFGVSCDSTASLRVFGEQERFSYPLLSDFWPHGEVSRAFGVFLEDKGFSNRGSFVIDGDGVVRWSVVTSPAEPRDAAALRDAVVGVLERAA